MSWFGLGKETSEALNTIPEQSTLERMAELERESAERCKDIEPLHLNSALDLFPSCWRCGHVYTSEYDFYHGHKH